MDVHDLFDFCFDKAIRLCAWMQPSPSYWMWTCANIKFIINEREKNETKSDMEILSFAFGQRFPGRKIFLFSLPQTTNAKMSDERWGAHWITNWQLGWNMIVNLYAPVFVFFLFIVAHSRICRRAMLFTCMIYDSRDFNHKSIRISCNSCNEGMPTNDKTTDTNKWLITLHISIDSEYFRRKTKPVHWFDAVGRQCSRANFPKIGR